MAEGEVPRNSLQDILFGISITFKADHFLALVG